MSKGKVYLAGPISGLSYGESVDWREDAERVFSSYDIEALSPMRSKEFLANVNVLDTGYEEFKAEYEQALVSDRGIMTRDYHDCTTSDVVLVNLLDAKKVSIGTVMEIAWAYAHNIPVVVVMEAREGDKRNNLHDHGMINEATGYRVTSLDTAYKIVATILNAKLNEWIY